MEEKVVQFPQMMEETVQQLITIITSYGLDMVGAVVTLIIGCWLSGKIAGVVRASLTRIDRMDITLVSFFGSMTRYLLLTVTFIAVLNQFGIETTSLVAVVGAASLAIGLALQGTLSNVAAGVMLLFFRPFKAGDFVEVAGQAGIIKELNLFVTEMATVDNVRVMIPNGKIWGDTLKNFSANDTRRVDFVFGVSYRDDLDKVEATLMALAAEDERIFKDPAPFVVVGEMADSSVNFIVRVWCKSPDYWGVKFSLNKAVKQRFDADKISFPFPTQTIHIKKN
jgi:small conductance mechanosensitive channel